MNQRQRQHGFSLVELCVAMALGVLVSLGTASLVQTAVNASISDRAMKQQAFLQTHIITRIQTDMMMATHVEVQDNQVDIERLTSSGTEVITWAYDAGNSTFTREGDDIRTIIGQTGTSGNVTLACDTPCFSGLDEDGAASSGISPANPVLLFEMSGFGVTVASNDAITQAFGSTGMSTDTYRFFLPTAQTFQ